MSECYLNCINVVSENYLNCNNVNISTAMESTETPSLPASSREYSLSQPNQLMGDFTESSPTQYEFGAVNDMFNFLTLPSTPAYVCVTNCNNSIFVNMKQFVKNEMTGMYSCNGEITLSMADFSALMLTLRSIENKLSADNKIVIRPQANLSDKFSKKSKKSKNTYIHCFIFNYVMGIYKIGFMRRKN